MITGYDLQHMRAAYPDLDIEPLTVQEERVLLYVLRGLTIPQAAKAVGMTGAQGHALAKSESFEVMRAYLEEFRLGKQQLEIKVTRDTLTQMLFEAHAKSATATEEISAIRELGKMHDLYLDAQRKAGVEINIGAKATSTKHLERMDDDMLIELSGEDYSLEPSVDG